jgi:hypothetical protein
MILDFRFTILDLGDAICDLRFLLTHYQASAKSKIKSQK